MEFIYSVKGNISLGLTEDFTFYRAMNYVDVDLYKIPNTCEKTIFLKNICKLAKPIWKAKSWDSVAANIMTFSESCLTIFDKIFKKYVVVMPNKNGLDKKSALEYLGMFYALIYLNDTQFGEPLGYRVSVFQKSPQIFVKPDILQKTKLNRNIYLKVVFQGYKYALQYLWYNLVDKKIFDKFLSGMHFSVDWVHQTSIAVDAGGELINSTSENVYLDDFFRVISEEIITPLEKNLEIKTIFSNLLTVNNKIHKQDFGILLSDIPKEMKYAEKEKLDQLLYWYRTEILEGMHIFNGVPAFISVLSGLVENRRLMGIEEKVSVVRFKHPGYSDGQYYYSYGVLVEAVSNVLADYSGWIIFFDCATDFSGFGGFEYHQAEQFIELYKKQNKIDVKEMVIDKVKFLSYLKDKTVSRGIKKDLEKKEDEKLKGNKFNESRGLLLELLLYFTLSKLDYKNLEWGYKKKKLAFDLIGRKEEEIHFFECKLPLRIDYNEECKKFVDKVNKIIADNSFLREMNIIETINKKLFFVFWKKPIDSILKIIAKNGIEVWILSDILKMPAFRRIKQDKLNFVLAKENDIMMNLNFTEFLDQFGENTENTISN